MTAFTKLSEMREGMVGQLRIGAIPVTLPIISLLTAPFAKRHGRTDIVVHSQTSIEVITRPEGAFCGRSVVSWSEAASLPLCLLTPDMQNRRIIDMHFREAGAEFHASAETNSLVTLWCHVRFGHWSTVVPHTFLMLVGEMDGLTAIPLTEPNASHLIGLVASDRDPLPPVAHAFLAIARKLEL